MVDGEDRLPGGGGVTILAHLGGVEVFAVLVGGMAAGAVIGDAGVVEGGRQPGVGGVAIVALGGGQQVIAVLVAVVVATGAGAEHLEVVDGEDRLPFCSAVAAIAGSSSGDVVNIYPSGFDAVVTTCAGA